MDFIELARERYSLKKYDGRKVSKEKLDLILEAARLSPTAKNLQNYFNEFNTETLQFKAPLFFFGHFWSIGFKNTVFSAARYRRYCKLLQLSVAVANLLGIQLKEEKNFSF